MYFKQQPKIKTNHTGPRENQYTSAVQLIRLE